MQDCYVLYLNMFENPVILVLLIVFFEAEKIKIICIDPLS